VFATLAVLAQQSQWHAKDFLPQDPLACLLIGIGLGVIGLGLLKKMGV
jgi:hypothetical protein